VVSLLIEMVIYMLLIAITYVYEKLIKVELLQQLPEMDLGGIQAIMVLL